MKKLLFFFLLLPAWLSAQYGSLSPAGEISILTIGPGSQLYDKFGHSAFRVKDSLAGVDLVFNYGVYDFDTPNFYTKFAQGKLLYQLGLNYYHDFYQNYVAENRWIKEQQLNLTKEEKQKIVDFLWNNALPENKDYLYDFFYDNCATKIRDVLIVNLDGNLNYKDDHIQTQYTFRELIQKNLKANTWGSLGIDTALGAIIDRDAKPIEYQFLPQYVYEGAENATIIHDGKEEPLVKKETLLFQNKPVEEKNNFFLSPLSIFGLIGLLIIWITFKDIKRKKRSRTLDVIIFSVTGLIGVLLFLLWFATDHTATANNYNLLWAFPLSLIFVSIMAKKKLPHYMRRYIFLLVTFLALLFIHWLTGVQEYPIGLLPLFIALAFRYVYLLTVIGRRKEEPEPAV